MTPDALNRLVAQLSKLPGIGEKTAQRLAFHVLRSPPEYARNLSQALLEVVDKVRLCPRCFSLTDGPTDQPCGFCTDTRRDDKVLCVVEGIADELAIERTREFRGRYHVLHGVLSPLEGVGPDQLRIRELLVRLESGAIDEVIVATNPDVEGEATALYLVRLLRPMGIKVTRLAQGIPMGGDLEYADQATLARALAARRDLEPRVRVR
ncbi:MAG: recombination protein RecR [Archangiaceae bacterium]|nr:recombination protein RecR [Archangiaceae bacterium]